MLGREPFVLSQQEDKHAQRSAQQGPNTRSIIVIRIIIIIRKHRRIITTEFNCSNNNRLNNNQFN